MNDLEAAQEVGRILQRQFKEERARHNAMMGNLILATQNLIREAKRAASQHQNCSCPTYGGNVFHYDDCTPESNPLEALRSAAFALDRVGFPNLVTCGAPSTYFQNQKHFTEMPDAGGKDSKVQ